MAVTVSSDLSISVSEDHIVKKLTDKQEILRESIQKGEPKAMGVSQVMLGYLVITYSIPLLSGEFTEIVRFGVPWWSGISFVIAGAFALVMEKRNSIKLVLTCLAVTVLAAFISVIALIFYVVDIFKNSETECHSNMDHLCDELHYANMFSKEMKSILTCLNVVQTVISSAFSYILYNERKRFISYRLVN
ncbi:transmembrane protein 176 [Colossoma macropomum]|uniref:transmembrane protein 176 n=1 Tax=Colossoma macropomum TaxID=42526 RepID=UPI001863E866|nr:transmembrane protein 176 [Colossoma macropomum]